MSNADKEASCYKIKCVHGDSYGICVGLAKSKSINVCFMEKKDESYEPVNGLTIDSKAAQDLSYAILKADLVLDTLEALPKFMSGMQAGMLEALKERFKTEGVI